MQRPTVFNVNLHFHFHDGSEKYDHILETLAHIKEEIRMTRQEELDKLKALDTKLDKIGTEVVGLQVLIQDLKNLQTDAPADVAALITKIEAKAQGIDDLVEETPAPTPTITTNV